MTYTEAVQWLFSQLPMFQRIGAAAYKANLDNILAFAKHLNHPEKKLKCIHIAGTNGKGSTSNMTAAILQQQGFKVGLYTSPHLKDYRERIRINGEMISENDVVAFVSENKAFMQQQQLSFFEMTVGLAFDYFAKQSVDYAVIEVGMGGRLDATNIITPLVTAITNISFDHTQFLGDTLEKIAIEKAGIIKNNTPLFVGRKQIETAGAFEKIAADRQAEIHYVHTDTVSKYKLQLQGNYQPENAALALAICKEVARIENFELKEQEITTAFARVQEITGFQGRWQILAQNPLTIADTAHNSDGLQRTLKQVLQQTYDQLHIVLGVVTDKDLPSILPFFPKSATYYFAKPDIPRGLAAADLQKTAASFDLIGKIYNSVPEAYAAAKQQSSPADLIFIGGSTFVVAEIL